MNKKRKIGGLRYNEGKAEMSMVLEARAALEGVSRVLTHGRKKYTRGNWRKGLKQTEIVDSLARHMAAFMSGETYDTGPKGSGLPHVDHILCNALFLSEMFHTRSDLDDRVIRDNAPTKRGRRSTRA